MIWTLGTSNRTLEEFFQALAAREIKTIVDVRSRPWSRLPWARQSILNESAASRGVAYAWMGGVLGGLNDIRTDDPAFLAALDRVLALEANGGPVAMCCAEGNPSECHRVWKCGAALLVHRGIDPINILRDGREELVSRTLLRTKAENIPSCVRDAALRASMKAAVA